MDSQGGQKHPAALNAMCSGNPWGYREWNGDWSDYSADGNGSAKWKENPQLCARLDPKRSILDFTHG